MKKALVIILAFAMTFSIVGCSESNKNSGQPAESESGEGLNIAIVNSSGVDDGSFTEDCYSGILEFIENDPESKVTDVKNEDMNQLVQITADIIADYDAVVLPGYQFAPVGSIAQDNPDRKVILVDTEATDADGNEMVLDNVYAMIFKEQEGGFFAGVAAALETKTNKVAVVNGIAFPTNVNYQYGFEAGVRYTNKHLGTNVEVVEIPSYAGTDVTGKNVGGNYVGHFADVETGKVIGNTLIEQGCDIIFVAAGDSGNGVFTAVKEANDVYVIGCDADQYDDGQVGDRNIILTSAIKNMRDNVALQLQKIKDGTFEGKNELLGADTDSTGYIKKEGRHQLGDETLKKLEEVYTLVKDGTIVPPSNFSEATVDNFPGL